MGHRFERPPIHELVIGMAFSEPLFDFIAYSKLYEKVKNNYPNTKEREAIFHPQLYKNTSMKLDDLRITQESNVRYWFISQDGSRLIQIQNNCFYLNWRKNDVGENEYPSFRSLISEFKMVYDILSEITNKNNLDKSAEFELTYIDHLFSEPIDKDFSNIGKIINYFDIKNFVKNIEGCSFRFNKKLPEFSGMYDVHFQSAHTSKTLKNVITVNTSVKGKVNEKYMNYNDWFMNASYFIVEDFVNHLTNDARKEFGYYVSK